MKNIKKSSSLDLFKGNNYRKPPYFMVKKPWFPVYFPLNQSNDILDNFQDFAGNSHHLRIIPVTSPLKNALGRFLILVQQPIGEAPKYKLVYKPI